MLFNELWTYLRGKIDNSILLRQHTHSTTRDLETIWVPDSSSIQIPNVQSFRSYFENLSSQIDFNFRHKQTVEICVRSLIHDRKREVKISQNSIPLPPLSKCFSKIFKLFCFCFKLFKVSFNCRQQNHYSIKWKYRPSVWAFH